MTHPLVTVALEAIKRHLAGEPAVPGGPASREPLPWGVFVSLHERGPAGGEGPLRGCIGSLDLSAASLEGEVARVAVSSATTDPRFPPLRPQEVDDLSVTVYLLDRPEVVDGPGDLDPQTHGVVVTGPGGERGLLLPGIPGIHTPERQFEVAVRKAGLPEGSKVSIERFTAEVLR